MTADLYQRPSRDVIAAKVTGHLPGTRRCPECKAPAPGHAHGCTLTAPAPKPEAQPPDGLDGAVTRREPEGADYVARFATHLKGRMRALGWGTADLIERTGYSQPTITRALNGTGVALEIAASLAGHLGSSLPAMLIPYQCGTCHGEPPAGFTCMECGTERRAS